jgi:hypothetical protein
MVPKRLASLTQRALKKILKKRKYSANLKLHRFTMTDQEDRMTIHPDIILYVELIIAFSWVGMPIKGKEI